MIVGNVRIQELYRGKGVPGGDFMTFVTWKL